MPIRSDVNNIMNGIHSAQHRLIQSEGNQEFSTDANNNSRQYLSFGTICGLVWSHWTMEPCMFLRERQFWNNACMASMGLHDLKFSPAMWNFTSTRFIMTRMVMYGRPDAAVTDGTAIRTEFEMHATQHLPP